MIKRVFVVLVTLVATSSMAVTCPVEFGTDKYLDLVGQAIQSTKSCYEGAEIAKACALGASGDVFTAGVAEYQCREEFWSKLTQSDRATFLHLRDRCTEKYKDKQGTMYLSMEAFCRLSVSELYANLFTLEP
jgi:hypothetical protein